MSSDIAIVLVQKISGGSEPIDNPVSNRSSIEHRAANPGAKPAHKFGTTRSWCDRGADRGPETPRLPMSIFKEIH